MSAFTSREHHALTMQLFRSGKLDGKGECWWNASFHHIPEIFSEVNIWDMRWQGKVLEVRLVLSKSMLNNPGSMCMCIIVHEVSVAIRLKMLHCRVYLICQYI